MGRRHGTRPRSRALRAACAGAAALAAGPCAVQPVRRVLLVGATHGNELTGAWVIQRLERWPELAARPSLDAVIPVLGNPEAYRATRRFMDVDLNRQFRRTDLTDLRLGGYEHLRAKVLDAHFGRRSPPDEAADFVIDMHTSTSSMGISFILERWSDVALAAAAWCQQQLEPRCVTGELPPVRIIRESLDKTVSPHLITMCPHGLMIEIGPVPQGLLRHDACRWMDAAISAVLDFLEAMNSGSLELPRRVEIFSDLAVKIPAPLGSDGKPMALFHGDFQDSDFKPLRTGDPMFLDLDGKVLRYDGRHGEVIWPTFINEAAYYLPESGLGFGVTLREEVDVPAPVMVSAAT